MRVSEFDHSIQRLVSPFVEPWGFTSTGGKGCSFRRQAGEDLFHFIVFDLKSNGQHFEIHVFPATPRLGKEQWVSFPNFVGMPTGSRAGLNAKSGVGGGASRFPCKDAAALQTSVTRVVLPTLELHVRSYFANFRTVEDIIPVLEYPQWAELLQ